jgi:hypothetical protein
MVQTCLDANLMTNQRAIAHPAISLNVGPSRWLTAVCVAWLHVESSTWNGRNIPAHCVATGIDNALDGSSCDSDMSDHDLLGSIASGLVLTSFWMRDMLSLRLLAIASNIAFVNYGHVAHILPVMVLHAILLPVNLWHVLPMLRRGFATRLERNAGSVRTPRAAREE